MQRRKFACKGLRAKVGGGLGRKQRKCLVTFDHIMLPCTLHAEDHSYSLLTTPILYCKHAALYHVYTAQSIHSLVTIGPPSSSTLSEKGLGNEATHALASGQISMRCDSARLPGTYSCLESREPDRFRLCMGVTLVYNLTYVLGPTPFLHKGCSKQRGRHS